MSLTVQQLRDIEEALEACAMLHRDGFIHGPGSHFPEYVFVDLIPPALLAVTQAVAEAEGLEPPSA